MDDDLETEYKGTQCRVVHCKGAAESFKVALEKVPGKGRKQSMRKSMIFLINRLARGYVWLSKRLPGTYFISHYVL